MSKERTNRLNNLSNSQWLKLTSSVWWSTHEFAWHHEGNKKRDIHAANENGQLPLLPTLIYSSPQPADELKRQHPATFAESDIRKLILFFTKKQEIVLDPFLGSGSTCNACYDTSRNAIGIELFPHWVSLSKKRLIKATAGSVRKCRITKARDVFLETKKGLQFRILCGDSRIRLNELSRESVDFVVTSPPYWSILSKDGDYKVQSSRRRYRLPTHYGHSTGNLGEISDYPLFLSELQKIFHGCAQVLRRGRYLCVIAGDFRHGDQFYPFHLDLIDAIRGCGLALEGITIIAHNRKYLYPYGMPYAYVSNIHHSYALIFRKRVLRESSVVDRSNVAKVNGAKSSRERRYIV